MIAAGLLATPGVHVPERLAEMDGVVESVLHQLAERGVAPTFRAMTSKATTRRAARASGTASRRSGMAAKPAPKRGAKTTRAKSTGKSVARKPESKPSKRSRR
jgi:hypothetical protein